MSPEAINTNGNKAPDSPKKSSRTRAWLVATLLGTGVPLFAQEARAEEDPCLGNLACAEEMLQPQEKDEVSPEEENLMNNAKDTLEQHSKNFTFKNALAQRNKLEVLDLIKMVIDRSSDFRYSEKREGQVVITKRRLGDVSIPGNFELILIGGNLVTARGTINDHLINANLNPKEWIRWSKLLAMAEPIRQSRIHREIRNGVDKFRIENPSYPRPKEVLENALLENLKEEISMKAKKTGEWAIIDGKEMSILEANLFPYPSLNKFGTTTKPEEVLKGHIERFKNGLNISVAGQEPGRAEGKQMQFALEAIRKNWGAAVERMYRKRAGNGKLDDKKWEDLRALKIDDLLAEFGNAPEESILKDLVRKAVGRETEAEAKARGEAEKAAKKEAEEKTKSDTKAKEESKPVAEPPTQPKTEPDPKPESSSAPKAENEIKAAEKSAVDAATAPWLALDWLKAELANEKRPVLMEIGAEWCGPCKQLAPELKKVESRMGGKVRVLKVDLDQHKDILDPMGKSKNIPRLVLFVKGKVIDANISQRDASSLIGILNQHVK